MDISLLKKRIEMTFSEQISIEEFVQWYEDWFYDESNGHLTNEKTFTALENLYNDIGYFEPNEEIRKEHSSYFGRERLLEKLKKTLEELSE